MLLQKGIEDFYFLIVGHHCMCRFRGVRGERQLGNGGLGDNPFACDVGRWRGDVSPCFIQRTRIKAEGLAFVDVLLNC